MSRLIYVLASTAALATFGAQAKERYALAPECRLISTENEQRCCRVITPRNVDACAYRPGGVPERIYGRSADGTPFGRFGAAPALDRFGNPASSLSGPVAGAALRPANAGAMPGTAGVAGSTPIVRGLSIVGGAPVAGASPIGGGSTTAGGVGPVGTAGLAAGPSSASGPTIIVAAPTAPTTPVVPVVPNVPCAGGCGNPPTVPPVVSNPGVPNNLNPAGFAVPGQGQGILAANTGPIGPGGGQTSAPGLGGLGQGVPHAGKLK